ncbi:MAG: DUF222 domain-containing protein [Sporichthyaceae bacterium]
METSVLTPELEAFAGLEVAVEHALKLVGDQAWRLAEPDVLDLLRRGHVLASKLASLQLSLVREAQTRGMAASNAATSDTALLAGLLRMSPGTAKATCTLTSELHTRFPDTRACLAAGEIAVEQARAITETVTGLPKDTAAEDSVWAEGFLLAQAKVLDSVDLRKLGKRIAYAIDPDGSLDYDEAAKRRRELSITENHNGTQTIRWTETDEHVAIVKAAIGALAAPLPGEDGTPDPRTAGVRRADALLEVCRHALRSGTLPRQRGERPHVHLTVRADDLRAGTGFGTTETGEDLTIAAIRRMSCDSNLTALLLNADGVPLKVGRDHRTVTHGQWIALVERDRGCVFPGCTRPAAWTEAHHVRHWADGGPTDLDNMVLLCSIHHDHVHHRGWTVSFAEDQRPELIPPAWVDFEQRPRRNPHWHRSAQPRPHESTDP